MNGAIDPREVAVAVLAKTPQAGFSKTRLHPPFSLEEAARLAEAMLQDVLAAVAATRAGRRVVVLAGEPGAWLPDGFEVLPQEGSGHAARIGAAFAAIGGPALLIGMDTPQVTPALLEGAAESLAAPGVDAVLGPAADGGWWAAGLRTPDPAVFRDVPMSLPDTIDHQRRSFESRGLRWSELAELADIDDAATARAVAASAPRLHFSRLLAALDARRMAAAE